MVSIIYIHVKVLSSASFTQYFYYSIASLRVTSLLQCAMVNRIYKPLKLFQRNGFECSFASLTITDYSILLFFFSLQSLAPSFSKSLVTLFIHQFIISPMLLSLTITFPLPSWQIFHHPYVQHCTQNNHIFFYMF